VLGGEVGYGGVKDRGGSENKLLIVPKSPLSQILFRPKKKGKKCSAMNASKVGGGISLM